MLKILYKLWKQIEIQSSSTILSKWSKKRFGYWICIYSYSTNTLCELDEKLKSKIAITVSIEGAKYYKYMGNDYGKKKKIKTYDYIIQIQIKHTILNKVLISYIEKKTNISFAIDST